MRLRNKTQYSDVAFNLMQKEFTLPDLQRVYEIILGKQLYKTSFKRSINDKIIIDKILSIIIKNMRFWIKYYL